MSIIMGIIGCIKNKKKNNNNNKRNSRKKNLGSSLTQPSVTLFAIYT